MAHVNLNAAGDLARESLEEEAHATSNALPDPVPWPRPGLAWYTVAILLIAYMFAYVDRAILTVLVEPIQRDFHINDTQIGLLHGFAFVIFYASLGVPLGYIADRFSRKKLIVVSIALWSLATASGAMTKSFGGLFASRIAVGIGEAGLSPASYSMIADNFAPAKRSLATGIYTIAIYLGGGMAILIGGALVAIIGPAPTVVVPVLGTIRAWQLLFLMVGLPGLIVSAIALTLREPARHAVSDEVPGQTLGSKLAEVLSHIKSLRRLYLCHFFGFAFLGVSFNVVLLWARPYLSRSFGMGRSDAAMLVGTLMIVFATAGIICGSLLADRWQARGKVDATVRVGLLASSMILIPLIAYPMMSSVFSVGMCLALLLFCGAFSFGAAPPALHLVTPNRMRAIASGLYLMVNNLVALTVGPTLTGALTDYVFHDPRQIGLASSIVGAGSACIAIVLFALMLRPYREAAIRLSPGVVKA